MTLYVVMRKGERDPVFCSFDKRLAVNFVEDSVDHISDDANEQLNRFSIDEYEK
jgi:hypothetical protein